MRRYQVPPQRNGGLRTCLPAENTASGGIEASYHKGFDTRCYRPYILEIRTNDSITPIIKHE